MSSGRNWTKCNFRDLVSAHSLKKEMWVWVNIFWASKINTQMLPVGNTINWWILSTDPCPCDLNDDWYDWSDSYDCSDENPLRTYYPLCWSSCLWSCHNFALTFPSEASWATWWGFWCGCSDLLSLGNYKSPTRSPLNHQPVSLGIIFFTNSSIFGQAAPPQAIAFLESLCLHISEWYHPKWDSDCRAPWSGCHRPNLRLPHQTPKADRSEDSPRTWRTCTVVNKFPESHGEKMVGPKAKWTDCSMQAAFYDILLGKSMMNCLSLCHIS